MEYESVTDHDRRRMQDGAESSLIVIELDNGMRRKSGTAYETAMVYVAWHGMASEEVDALVFRIFLVSKIGEQEVFLLVLTQFYKPRTATQRVFSFLANSTARFVDYACTAYI